MTIFYIDPGHQAAAAKLSKKEGSGRPVQLEQETPRLIAGSTDITIYAHSSGYVDNQTDRLVGGLSPEELATLLANKIENKKDIQDLYLLSCEAGLSVRGKTYAEAFVKALVNKGFKKDIKVHAVSGPEGAKAMRVNVTSQAGIAGAMEHRVDGQVEAFYYGNKYTELLDETLAHAKEKRLPRLVREITEEIKQAKLSGHYQKDTFFSSGRYKEDMSSQPAYRYEDKKPQPARLSKEVAKIRYLSKELIFKLSFELREIEIDDLQPIATVLKKYINYNDTDLNDPVKAEAVSMLLSNLVDLAISRGREGIPRFKETFAEYAAQLDSDIAVITQGRTSKEMAQGLVSKQLFRLVDKAPITPGQRDKCKALLNKHYFDTSGELQSQDKIQLTQSLLRNVIELAGEHPSKMDKYLGNVEKDIQEIVIPGTSRAKICASLEEAHKGGLLGSHYKTTVITPITRGKQKSWPEQSEYMDGIIIPFIQRREEPALQAQYHVKEVDREKGGRIRELQAIVHPEQAAFKAAHPPSLADDEGLTFKEKVVRYRNKRKKEYVIQTVLNVITLSVFGRVYKHLCPGKAKENKLEASRKLSKYLGEKETNPHAELPEFNKGEKAALKDGRLSRIVDAHKAEVPGLEEHLADENTSLLGKQ